MSVCKACRGEILWCKTDAGKNIPVDLAPDNDGNVIVTGTLGRFRAQVLSAAEARAYTGDRLSLHKAHFATCPFADRFRKKTR